MYAIAIKPARTDRPTVVVAFHAHLVSTALPSLNWKRNLILCAQKAGHMKGSTGSFLLHRGAMKRTRPNGAKEHSEKISLRISERAQKITGTKYGGGIRKKVNGT